MTTPNHVVTGATDGIGFETALQLARHGARVLVHGRTADRSADACARLRNAEPRGEFVPVHGDFGKLSDVRALAKQIADLAPQVDVLVNNAGVFMKTRVETVDGFETTFQVNHLAPFLLTVLLLPQLKAARAARVVNVSSMAHARGNVDLEDLGSRDYDGYGAYASSKLLNVHFTHELARKLEGTKVTTYALHPGVITTKLLKTGFGMGGAPLESGAKTSVYCATSPSLEGVTGKYYSDSREKQAAPQAYDAALEAKVWAISERLSRLG
ncbi:MAG: SDR family oxidoreductase [Archangium sp.]|nr:SDR family oxidoreductase [Archangium sp.]